MQIRPDAILLCANRRIVGWSPGADVYAELDEAALHWLDGLTGDAPLSDVVRRLFRDPRPWGSRADLPLPECLGWHDDAASPDLAQAHVIGDRLALYPGQDGWHLWAAERPRAALPKGFLPLLAAFTEGAVPQDLIDRSGDPVRTRRILNGLVRDGALVSRAVRAQREADLLARARREDALVQTAPQIFANPGPASRERRGDGSRRVPAYFVQSSISRSSMWHPDGARPVWGRSNYLPLALGMILAHVQSADGGALCRDYRFVPQMITDIDSLEAAVTAHGTGIAFFSDYEWNLDANLLMSEALKEADPRFVCVHGGPSAPKYDAACARFMADHPHVDVVVRGEGEETARALLEALAGRWPHRDLSALDGVPGLTWRAPDGQPRRMPDRPRISDLDSLRSPYLSGVFDGLSASGTLMAVVETNRGCPYGCTFCDWGSAIQSKIRRFDIDRVKAEIDWVTQKGFHGIWCADANFGILPRDEEIAEHLIARRQSHGAPRQFFVNYAKNATPRMVKIVDKLLSDGVMSEGVIAVQSLDDGILDRIDRANIKSSNMMRLLTEFQQRRVPVSADLMIALPGATPQAFRADLQSFFDLNVPAKAYMTRVLPNSPMAAPSYLERQGIKTDEMGFIRSAAGFGPEERDRMVAMFRVYRALLGAYGVVRYVAAHVQQDHGIAALEQIDALSDPASEAAARCPALVWAAECLHGHRTGIGDWARPLHEFAHHLQSGFAVQRDSALETALRVQRAVLPSPWAVMPQTLELEHDFAAYWRDLRRGRARKLASYPPGVFVVSDPDALCLDDPMRSIHGGSARLRDWELVSDLRAHKARRVLQVLDRAELEQRPELGLY